MSERWRSLDVVRGWALVWMFASHIDVVWGGDRWLPNGWGLMVFVVVSGSLVRGFRFSRWLRLYVGALIAGLFLSSTPLNGFTVLHAWAIALPVVAWVAASPLESRGVRVLVAATIAAVGSWALPVSGVSPWLVILGGVCGLLLGSDALAASLERVRGPRLVELIGRRPLRAYVLHAVAIGLAATL